MSSLKLAPRSGGELEPARAEDAQDVAVGEQRDVAVRPPARGRSRGRRARRRAASVSPPGASHTDQPGRSSRISAVVRPFVGRRRRARPGRGRSPGSKPASARRLERALQRRGEHERELAPREPLAQRRAPPRGRARSAAGRSSTCACPDALHSVSPCRARTIHRSTSSPVPAPHRRAAAPAPGPAFSSTTNALPSRHQVVLPADRGPAIVRQRAQRQPGAARVLALDRAGRRRGRGR